MPSCGIPICIQPDWERGSTRSSRFLRIATGIAQVEAVMFWRIAPFWIQLVGAFAVDAPGASAAAATGNPWQREMFLKMLLDNHATAEKAPPLRIADAGARP